MVGTRQGATIGESLMFFNPALVSQLRARPVGPGQPGVPLMGQAPPGTGPDGQPLPAGGSSPFESLFSPEARERKRRKDALGNVQLPFFQDDRNRLGGMLEYRDPYAGAEWAGLIGQLQERAAGRGPSIAGDAYKQASQDTTASIGSIAAGSGSPAAARQAVLQQGRVGQGLAQGYASARNQEMVGAQSALAGALSQRDQLNQNAYLDILAKQLGLSRDQLAALQGNQQFQSNKDAANAQKSAAKWNALGGLAGGLGGIL